MIIILQPPTSNPVAIALVPRKSDADLAQQRLREEMQSRLDQEDADRAKRIKDLQIEQRLAEEHEKRQAEIKQQEEQHKISEPPSPIAVRNTIAVEPSTDVAAVSVARANAASEPIANVDTNGVPKFIQPSPEKV